MYMYIYRFDGGLKRDGIMDFERGEGDDRDELGWDGAS